MTNAISRPADHDELLIDDATRTVGWGATREFAHVIEREESEQALLDAYTDDDDDDAEMARQSALERFGK